MLLACMCNICVSVYVAFAFMPVVCLRTSGCYLLNVGQNKISQVSVEVNVSAVNIEDDMKLVLRSSGFFLRNKNNDLFRHVRLRAGM